MNEYEAKKNKITIITIRRRRKKRSDVSDRKSGN